MSEEHGCHTCVSAAYWLARIRTLDDAALERLTPLLDADDATDSLRKLTEMLPELTETAATAAWRDDYVVAAFRIRTIAEYLESGGAGRTLTIEAWCRERLEAQALRDSDFKDRLLSWCVLMLATHGELSRADDLAALLDCVRCGRCQRMERP